MLLHKSQTSALLNRYFRMWSLQDPQNALISCECTQTSILRNHKCHFPTLEFTEAPTSLLTLGPHGHMDTACTFVPIVPPFTFNL